MVGPDISMIPLAKAAADPSGHYSRPDATRLILDKRPQPAVEIIGESSDAPGARPAETPSDGSDELVPAQP